MTASPIVRSRVVVDGAGTRMLRVPGEGPPLVLVHGYTDSADTWHEVLERLGRAGRAAVAVDLPGHGAADPAPPDADDDLLDRFVAALVEQVAAEHGGPVVLVGNSLGAALVLRHVAAAGAPGQRVQAVFAISTPYRAVHPGLRALPYLAPVLGRVLRLPSPEPLAGAVLTRLYLTLAARPGLGRAVRDRYRSHLDRPRVGELVGLGPRFVAEIPTMTALVGTGFGVPTTLWWGGRDRICPAPRHPRTHPSTRVVTDPRGVHCPQLTDPATITDMLLGDRGPATATGPADPPGRPRPTGRPAGTG